MRGSQTVGTLLFAVNEFRPWRLFACTKRMSNVVSGLRVRPAHKKRLCAGARRPLRVAFLHNEKYELAVILNFRTQQPFL